MQSVDLSSVITEKFCQFGEKFGNNFKPIHSNFKHAVAPFQANFSTKLIITRIITITIHNTK